MSIEPCLAIDTQQGQLSSAPYKVKDPFGNEAFSFSFQENGGLSISIPPETPSEETTETPPIVLQGVFSTNLLALSQGFALTNCSSFSLLATDLYLALIVAAFVMANDQPVSGTVSLADFNNAMSSHSLSNQVQISNVNNHGNVLNMMTFTLFSLTNSSESIKVTLSDWDRKTIRVIVSVGGVNLTYYIRRPSDDLERLLAILPDQKKPENRKRDPDEDPDPDTGVDSGCGACFWSLCCWCCNWGSSSELQPVNQGSIQYGSNQQRAVTLMFELDRMPSIVFSDLFKALVNETDRSHFNEVNPVKSVGAFQQTTPEAVSAW